MESRLKPLLILTRIIFVGCFWSIFFLEGIRVIMLRNWRFDIFRTAHWQHAWDLWYAGWVIDDPKEWAFVLIILTFIPLWLTGWAALSLISWGKVFLNIAMFPVKTFKNLFYKPVKIIAKTAGVPVVKKKKSYKEIRPRGTRAPIADYSEPIRTAGIISTSAPAKRKTPAAPKVEPTPTTATDGGFDHSLFKFDDNDDDFDFNFDAFDKPEEPKPVKAEKPIEKEDNRSNNNNKNKNNRDNNQNKKSNNRNERNNNPAAPASNPAPTRSGGNSSMDVIKQKGYEVITGATIKNNLIDFIGVSDKQLCLCLLDKEPGDWLADEERFNDEEPLWFSESSHRISPVRKIDLARRTLTEKLADSDLSFDVKAYVVVQIGNIINAEDMFETWEEMDISVTRIDRGTPKELKLFSKTLEEAGNPIDKEKFEKIKKLIRSIA